MNLQSGNQQSKAEGEGVEPPRLLRSAVFETVAVANRLALPYSSCGDRNRTCEGAVNSRLPVPTQAPPQKSRRSWIRTNDLLLPKQADFQAIPYADYESAQRESNPHFRHGKAVGCRYIMGTSQPRPNCQRDRGHRVGLEPTSPHYGCGVFAARRPVQGVRHGRNRRVGPEGLEPSPARVRTGCAAANT